MDLRQNAEMVSNEVKSTIICKHCNNDNKKMEIIHRLCFLDWMIQELQPENGG